MVALVLDAINFFVRAFHEITFTSKTLKRLWMGHDFIVLNLEEFNSLINGGQFLFLLTKVPALASQREAQIMDECCPRAKSVTATYLLDNKR